MQPVITIFCSFTRRWAIDGWLENLSKVEHDPAQTNLCFIVDCSERYIANAAKKFAEEHNYRSFHVKINEDWQPNEVRLAIRRARVAAVKNQSKDLIAAADGDIVIGLEDDTVFNRLASFKPLYEPLGDMIDGETVGFVEGVQMGRWGANIIGAWEFDDVMNPTEVKTLLPPDNPIVKLEEITGGGFYGYATYKELYLNHDYYTSTGQAWGPDVNYGVWLRQRGYKCLINWHLMFGHKDYSKVLYPDDETIRLAQVVYNKNTLTGKWDRTDHEQSRY